MSVNRTIIIFYGVVYFFILTAFSPKHTATDSLKIVSRGIQNSIVIDSSSIAPCSTDSVPVIFNSIKGAITQTGIQNNIEINSGNDSLKSGKTKSTVIIKQTGNNNSIKINSQ